MTSLFTGLGPLVPSNAVDVVGIFTESENTQGDIEITQIVDGARPVKASIDKSAEFFEHPLENSKKIVDHRIILPISIEISMLLLGEEFPNVYQQINQLFLDGTELVIQTKTDSYPKQVIRSMPHEETPEISDGVLLSFGTREVQISPVDVTFSPADETQASTVDRGEQLPKEATEEKSSVAAGLYDRVFGD